MKYRMLGLPVEFSQDGTWDVDCEGLVMRKAGSLLLTCALKAIELVERVTGTDVHVVLYEREDSRSQAPFFGQLE